MHLVEPGIDDVLLRRQVGRDLLMDLGGRGAELFALEHGALLERSRHGGVTFGSRLFADLGDRVVHGRVDRAADLGGGEDLLVGEAAPPGRPTRPRPGATPLHRRSQAAAAANRMPNNSETINMHS